VSDHTERMNELALNNETAGSDNSVRTITDHEHVVYTIRPMRRSDYHRGYLDVLRVLTTVGDITEEACLQCVRPYRANE
jgi:hypothetical protein